MGRCDPWPSRSLDITVAPRRMCHAGCAAHISENHMGQGFLPTSDADLLAWANAFGSQITTSAVAFGLTPALASSFVSVTAQYQSAYDEATNESTRTRGTVALKNTQRAQ